MPSFTLDVDDFRPLIDHAVDVAVRRLRDERPGGPEQLLLDKRQAAQALGVSASTIDRITAPKGDLRPVRLDGRVLFARSELERWANARMEGQEGGAS